MISEIDNAKEMAEKETKTLASQLESVENVVYKMKVRLLGEQPQKEKPAQVLSKLSDAINRLGDIREDLTAIEEELKNLG